MKQFADLFEKIDQTTSTNEKVSYLEEYFSQANARDGAWALFFLCGYRLKRFITSKTLFEWCQEATSWPLWLLEDSYEAVGDTAEVISLLLNTDEATSSDMSLADWMEKRLLPLRTLPLERQKEEILLCWKQMERREIFILNKILTGSLRVGVSRLLTLRGLSKAVQVPTEILSQKLMGHWDPSPEFFESLKEQVSLASREHLNPYPFYLASPLDSPLQDLGLPGEWLAEWKWDGIRAQCIHRAGKKAIWSRGNELISDQFPEILQALSLLPSGIVLDGEILAFRDQIPLPFGSLQKRLGRKKLSKAILEEVPLVFMIYDLLEYEDSDCRAAPLSLRRKILQEAPWKTLPLLLSPEIPFSDWEEIHAKRLEAKSLATEGIMLKKLESPYGVGRQRGAWWKYKIDPMTIDAVLLYAQAGKGRRANLYTDYTFGVWQENELIPIAKAYSGLSQEEINRLDHWIRRNTEEKFGPVRKVKAEQVFELAFEGIQVSKRHKSGVALRFPRIARWRKDKPMNECDTLDKIKETFLHER